MSLATGSSPSISSLERSFKINSLRMRSLQILPAPIIEGTPYRLERRHDRRADSQCCPSNEWELMRGSYQKDGILKSRKHLYLIEEAEEVVAIVVSANLSGMYNAAHLGAQEVPELKVHVVDSEQVSMGLGWIVIAAAEAAAEGKNAQEIISIVQDIKPRVRVFAMLDTLEYLRRSGRVSWARAAAAHGRVHRSRPRARRARPSSRTGAERPRAPGAPRRRPTSRAAG